MAGGLMATGARASRMSFGSMTAAAGDMRRRGMAAPAMRIAAAHGDPPSGSA
jgi:hypothetical protein